MALTADQQRMAQLIMGIGARRGLSTARQRELAAAAYAESGLNPRSVNKSSGAAGLFQLLSSGYRDRAQQLGGLYNPRANTLAIINDYVNYWRQHPNAGAGEAGRDVERSGEGASFYANPLSLVGGLAPGAAGPVAPPSRQPGPAAPGPQQNDAYRAALLQQLFNRRQGKAVDWLSLVRAQQQAAATAPSNPGNRDAGPVNDPKTGNWVDPATGKVIGTPYHGTHTLGNWESDRALDVAVPIGTPVRSPFAGTIGSQFGSLGASSGSRFAGLRLHVANPTNEWYGAHLSRFAPGIKPGVRVRPGQIVGYSGSASGVAHLHEALKYGDPYHLIR